MAEWSTALESEDCELDRMESEDQHNCNEDLDKGNSRESSTFLELPHPSPTWKCQTRLLAVSWVNLPSCCSMLRSFQVYEAFEVELSRDRNVSEPQWVRATVYSRLTMPIVVYSAIFCSFWGWETTQGPPYPILRGRGWCLQCLVLGWSFWATKKITWP